MVSKKTEELLNWDKEHIVHGRFPIGSNIGFVSDRSQGIYFYDTDGKEYIDGTSQLICVNLGYGQKEVINAINDELNRLQYAMLFHGFSNTPIIECGKMLSQLVPPGLDHFVWTTGGSESVDSALKLARFYWSSKNIPRYKIISLWDSYHGVTRDAITATGTGRGATARGLGPPQGGFIQIPSYYCYRCMFGLEYPVCNVRCARFLAEVIEKEGADNIAAFIAEPEMGVSGMIAPPPEYWPIVRDICTKYNVLLIADEVMTGFCRTGKVFAVENWGVRPDIMTMAKGITTAYIPFGAVAFTQEIWDAVKGKGFVYYTYGGHPVCAAAAIKTMEIYRRDKIAEHTATVGEYTLQRLQKDFATLPCVGYVGGLGLMLGIEIVADKATKRVFDSKVNVMQSIQNEALKNGLFVRVGSIAAGTGDRIAFCPPLIITEKEADKALDILYPILANLKP